MSEPIWDVWRCSNCGDLNDIASPAWRWNGEAWEHECGDPQVGYFPARNFGPRSCEKVLQRALEWWLREGYEQFIGAPEWVFAARTLLKS